MINLRFAASCTPQYMTENSAGCDLVSRIDIDIKSGQRAVVPAGVWIESVDWNLVPKGQLPELQIRARSGLAMKHGISMANGVGTIDADYRDEICVLLQNSSDKDFSIKQGDRIAQMLLNTVHRLPNVPVGGNRIGGFGSTGK